MKIHPLIFGAAAAAFLTVLACAGSPPSATVLGSVDGVTPGNHATMFSFSSLSGGYLELFIDNDVDVCSDAMAKTAVANDKALVINLSNQPTDGGAGGISQGMFSVNAPNGMTAGAILSQSNATCGRTAQDSAIGGTVTISNINDKAATGTFDVTFLNGSLNGTFNVTFCDAGTSPLSTQGPICRT